MIHSYRIQSRQIRQHSGLHCRTSRFQLCIHHWHISTQQVCRPLDTSNSSTTSSKEASTMGWLGNCSAIDIITRVITSSDYSSWLSHDQLRRAKRILTKIELVIKGTLFDEKDYRETLKMQRPFE